MQSANKKILSYLKPYAWIVAFSPVFMAGEVLMDLVQPRLMSRVIDDGVLGLQNNGIPDLGVLKYYGILMIVFTALGGICGIMCGVTGKYSATKFSNDIRKDCFHKIMSLSFSQTDGFTTGSLITRLTNDLMQIQNLVTMLVTSLVRNLTFIFGGILFLFWLNRQLGIVVIAAMPAVVLLVAVVVQKTNPLFFALQKKLDNVNGIMQEDVDGIRVIKAFGKEDYEKERFQHANDDMLGTQLRILLILSYLNPLMNIVLNLTVAGIIRVGGFQVQAQMASPGDIIGAITYVSQILNGILQMVVLFQSLSRGIVSFHRIQEVLYCGEDVANGSAKELPKRVGRVVLEDVSFCYAGCSEPALSNISLTFEPGQMTAILGTSGSGKSSLVHLIPRFYDATEGNVYVDGMDVREFPLKELRERVAVVFQKSELFSTTIEENLTWGNPNAPAEEIWQAAEDAQAMKFIQEQPGLMDTPVAERGMSLSGGQKQRIAIGRALLKQAEILILDDSTSALDARTEAQLYQSLREHYHDRTQIIITQRIASIRNADKIIVLDNGHLAGCGTHQELAESNPVYQKILRSQMQGGASYE